MATRRLKGSERSALPDAQSLGPADQNERLEVSVIVRPQAPEVLAEHSGTVRILHTMRPFAVVMAGPGEFDPFKD